MKDYEKIGNCNDTYCEYFDERMELNCAYSEDNSECIKTIEPLSSHAVLGDEPPLTDIGLCELELIACYDGGVYWFLDYRFRDDSGGAFLNSQIYKDDKAAIFALISGTIKWTECHTEK